MTTADPRHALTAFFLRHADRRLRRRYPEWAQAMAGEAAMAPEQDRLRWAAGCAAASYRAPGGLDALTYPALLLAGVAAMTAFQWSQDEGLGTVVLLSAIGLVLGFLRPRRVLTSALAIGSVVAAVNAFEAVSGIRPAYEIWRPTALQCAIWMVMVAPTLIASVIGSYASRKLKERDDETAA